MKSSKVATIFLFTCILCFTITTCKKPAPQDDQGVKAIKNNWVFGGQIYGSMPFDQGKYHIFLECPSEEAWRKLKARDGGPSGLDTAYAKFVVEPDRLKRLKYALVDTETNCKPYFDEDSQTEGFNGVLTATEHQFLKDMVVSDSKFFFVTAFAFASKNLEPHFRQLLSELESLKSQNTANLGEAVAHVSNDLKSRWDEFSSRKMSELQQKGPREFILSQLKTYEQFILDNGAAIIGLNPKEVLLRLVYDPQEGEFFEQRPLNFLDKGGVRNLIVLHLAYIQYYQDLGLSRYATARISKGSLAATECDADLFSQMLSDHSNEQSLGSFITQVNSCLLAARADFPVLSQQLNSGDLSALGSSLDDYLATVQKYKDIHKELFSQQ